jgi:fluoride exporter
MMQILLIGTGGFIGSVLRFLVSGAAQSLFRNGSFPFGTLAVNAIGCFIIGAISQLAETRGLFSDYSRSFLVIGFLGGFTTFSAFGNETMNLLRDGQTAYGIVNILLQVTLGLMFVLAGRTATLWFWR